MADSPRTCDRCILPEGFPGVSIDASGECSVCLAAGPSAEVRARLERLAAELEAVIAAERGTAGSYECVVAFSGGKDSSYVLKLLVETYRLGCLAVTVDNGFIAERARANGAAVAAALGVDLLVFRPAPLLMNRLYRQSALVAELHSPAAAKRASPLCTSCIGLINRQMLQLARRYGAPLVAGGYLGGQVPADSAVLRVDPEVLAQAGAVREERAIHAVGPELRRFFEPPHGGPKLTLLNPLVAVQVSEDAMIAELEPLGWRRTTDTGPNSTNCRLNELGILVHHRRYGFNPYLFEMAEQVRRGVLDREVALARARAIPEPEAVRQQAEQIGLDLRELG